MKKTLCLLLSVMTVLVGVGVAAAIANIPDAAPAEIEIQEPLYVEYNSAPVFSQIALEDADFNRVASQLNKSGKSRNETYSDVFDYLHFKMFYAPSKQNMDYLDTLILQGADLDKIIEIYDFWLTSGEPVAVIGQIYDASNLFTGTYWVEEAYNYVTQNRHGVLSAEQIDAYLSERVDAGDIQIANVLSRKGTATITQLLDRYAQGGEWPQLIADTGSIGAHAALTEISGQIDSAADLLTAIRYAAVMPQDTMLPAQAGTELDMFDAMRQALELRSVEIDSMVHTALLAGGIYPKDDSEQSAEANTVFRQRAVENGMSYEQIDTLVEQGYTMLDILNASEEAKVRNTTEEQLLQQQRSRQIGGTEVDAQ